MDPNTALTRIRELTAEHVRVGWLDESEVMDLVDLVTGLDEWLTSGGFLPVKWRA